jgi:hypothetical protein
LLIWLKQVGELGIQPTSFAERPGAPGRSAKISEKVAEKGLTSPPGGIY